jgi:hypothetical protein
MSPDDIDSITLDLYDFLVNKMKVQLDENDDYSALSSFMYSVLDKFVTRDRNYN